MELIDRYLHAVEGFLPKRDQQDIVRELGDDIRSQLEDCERELERPLTALEVETFLKEMGHPMLLAARFRPQRHLVGPALFPFYERTLFIAIGVALLVNVVIAATLVATGRPASEILDSVLRFPATTAVTVLGWVTLVFAIGEWTLGHTRVLLAWDPTRLPPVRRGEARVSRLQVFGEAVVSASFLAYLVLVPGNPWLLFGPAHTFLETSPVWERYYPAIVALVSLWLLIPVVNLFRPDWTRFRVAARLLAGVVSLILLGLLVDAGPYVAMKGTPTAESTKTLEALNLGVRLSFAITWIITLVDGVREGVRYWRHARARPAA